MAFGHWVNICRHGEIQAQCRCFGEKDVRLVTYHRPPAEPDMSLPDEATIITDTGVFHEVCVPEV